MRKKTYRSFTEARKFVRSLKLKDTKEWKVYCKSEEMPDDIPSNPNLAYKEFISLGDWFGTGFIAYQNREYLPPNEARIAIKKIAKEVFGGKVFTPKDWADAHKAGKIPANLPGSLWNIYNPDSTRNKMMKRKKQ